jgi:uncharacterized membrane protein YhaH (DUF805 family)
MSFGQAIRSCYSRYATFSGRAPRSEYWFFVLYQCLITAVCAALIPFGIGQALLWLFGFANLLPAISVTVRRLHDTDRSGWWYWFALVPLIGVIMLIVWFCTRGTSGANRFGPDPLSGTD